MDILLTKGGVKIFEIWADGSLSKKDIFLLRHIFVIKYWRVKKLLGMIGNGNDFYRIGQKLKRFCWRELINEIFKYQCAM